MTALTNPSRRGGSAVLTTLRDLARRGGAAVLTTLRDVSRRGGAAVLDVSRRFTWVLAAIALVAAMGGTWMTSATATAAPGDSLVRRPATAPADGATSARTTGATTTRDAGATGAVASARFDPGGGEPAPRKKQAVAGRLNLNTATEAQLMLLPQVGPAKAERIVTWRRKNGGFKRTADLRRVKGFGYKTFKRLEPLLDIRGDTTLAPRS